MTIDIRVVTADEFGAACLRALIEGVSAQAAPVIGLPTGNTPIPLFTSLRAAVGAGALDISSWRPFAIDEYGGQRNHPCSNRSFFERYWDVIPGAAPVEKFDPEAANLSGETRRMARALEKAGGLTLSLLGIGMNGHLAFNEPGSTPFSRVRKVALHQVSRASASACWRDEAPTWGLTLGLQELLAAPSVVLMANGAAKADIVARAIQGPESDDCPASFVRRAARTIAVLDEAAAGGLSNGAPQVPGGAPKRQIEV